MSIAPTVFLIGNSLTNNTVPPQIPNSDKHVLGGATLPYIVENPGEHTEQSTSWVVAFQDNWDILVLQPHFNSTLAGDIAAARTLIAVADTTTRIVIHTGWGRHANFVEDWEGGWDGSTMLHHPAYFLEMATELSVDFPTHQIAVNPAAHLLYKIAVDASSPVELPDLYRDAVHMNHNGRWLQHNQLRATLGLPWPHDPGFTIDGDLQTYFETKILIPTPPIWAGVGAAVVAAARRRRP